MSTSYQRLNTPTVKPGQKRPYLYTLLRSLRLQIVQPFKHEQPKVAIYQNRSVAALHTLLHIVPLGIAIALISLNLMTQHVGGVSSKSITTLQFAAKFLEILIQTSLATILLACIRNRLIVDQGPVAFGGLLAPYRMTSISYLWSLEFWGAATAFGPRTPFKVIFCLFVPLFVALAAFVGPSSAILMIPRVGRYKAADRLVYLGPSETVYPRSFGLIDSPGVEGINNTRVLFAEEDFNYTAWSLYASQSRPGHLPVRDLSDTFNSRILMTGFDSFNSDVSYSFTSVATIPTQFAVHILSQYTRLDDTHKDFLPTSYQPVVLVVCRQPKTCSSDSEYLESSLQGLNRTILRSDFNDPFNRNRTTSPLYLDNNNIDNANTTTLWAPHPKHSIMLASTVESSTDSDTNICPLMCYVNAQWLFGATNSSSLYTYENAGTSIRSTNASCPVDLAPELMIRLTQIARDLLPTIHPRPNEPLHDPVLEMMAPAIALMMSVSSTVPQNMRWNISDTSSGAAFWSRQGPVGGGGSKWLQHDGKKYDDVESYFDLDTVTDRSTVATMKTQVFWTDYGYSVRDTTVKLSLAVMLTYVLIVLSYLMYSLIRGYAATSWDSTADLVVLALNSQRPNGFDHTSVGVQTLDVFRRPVRVRVADDEACELVFSGQGRHSGKSFGNVEVNKMY